MLFFQIEEYRKKMEDYEKLANLQRNMTTEQAGMDREIKELKAKYAPNGFFETILLTNDVIKPQNMKICNGSFNLGQL